MRRPDAVWLCDFARRASGRTQTWDIEKATALAETIED